MDVAILVGFQSLLINPKLGWPSDCSVERGEGYRRGASQAQGEEEKTDGKGKDKRISKY